jgi:hypothetical protein
MEFKELVKYYGMGVKATRKCMYASMVTKIREGWLVHVWVR